MAAARTFAGRIRGALFLDIDTYEEVEADPSLTGQAAAVVLLAVLGAAIGEWGFGPLRIGGAAVRALLGWGIWAGMTYMVAILLGLAHTTSWGELLRTLGFAQAPGILAVFGIIPFLGWMVWPIIAIWGLVTGVIAIRQALDVGTGKALIVAVIAAIAAWIPLWVIRGLP